VTSMTEIVHAPVSGVFDPVGLGKSEEAEGC